MIVDILKTLQKNIYLFPSYPPLEGAGGGHHVLFIFCRWAKDFSPLLITNHYPLRLVENAQSPRNVNNALISNNS